MAIAPRRFTTRVKIMECRDEVTVSWRLGLHIRPATGIVKLLQKFDSEVTLTKNGNSCNAKSVIQLITLEARSGEKLSLWAKGSDCQQAAKAVKDFFTQYEDQDDGQWW